MIISQQHVTKHFSTYSPDSFTILTFDYFEVLLSKVYEYLMENPLLTETLGVSIVKSIICFLESKDNISKEQFEKLADFVKGGEKEDILKLLIKSHQLGSER